MKRLKTKYRTKVITVLSGLHSFSESVLKHHKSEMNIETLTRDEILQLIKDIEGFSDKLYLIRKSWTHDLEAMAEALTSEEGEQYLEQVDLPESLLRTVLGE
jgi:hypothetical protein